MSPAFRHRFRVRYAECDAQGVVFNAHYVTYFDNTITELWREAFGSYSAMLEAGTDMVVAEARVRYRQPAEFDDELEVAAEITRLGKTGMSTRFTVSRAGDSLVLTDAEIRHVFVDPSTKRKKPIPDGIRSRLAAYSSTPEAT